MQITINNKDFNHLLYMAQIVEARDPYTAGHLWRVAQMTKLLAYQLHLNDTDVFHLTFGAYLHDLGKVSVPDQVLNKKGRLESGELLQMRCHAEMGYRALIKHELGTDIAGLLRYHHEQWDGNGYPHQLKGEDIPFGARVLSILDAFDALTSNRPYRNAMSIDKAIEVIRQGSGTQFDPEVVDAFLALDKESLAHIVGHSDIGRALLSCPVCGPVVEMPPVDAKTTFCRVCTGKFNVMREDDGSTWIDFSGDYGKPEDLIAEPDMAHVVSNFAEFTVDERPWWKKTFKALTIRSNE